MMKKSTLKIAQKQQHCDNKTPWFIIPIMIILTASSWGCCNAQTVETTTTNNSSSTPPENSPPLYWNLSCPLEMSIFSNSHRASPPHPPSPFLERAILAKNMTLLTNSHINVSTLISKGAFNNRTVLFLGDSLMRQLFISLGCLSWSTSVKDSIIPWLPRFPTYHPNDIPYGSGSGYNAARLRFEEDGGDFIYLNIADRLFTHNEIVPMAFDANDIPIPEIRELVTLYSWIDSCRNRQPFVYLMINDLIFNKTTLTETRNIYLTKDDIVVMNAGVHPRYRQFFLDKFSTVVRCVEDAKSTGDDHPDWPTFVYMKTPMQHFKGTPTGEMPRGGGPPSIYENCAVAIMGNVKGDEDERYFGNVVSYMLGGDMNWEVLGAYHVQGFDCSHYTQPGIPDLLAAEFSNLAMSLSDNVV